MEIPKASELSSLTTVSRLEKESELSNAVEAYFTDILISEAKKGNYGVRLYRKDFISKTGVSDSCEEYNSRVAKAFSDYLDKLVTKGYIVWDFTATKCYADIKWSSCHL